MNETPSLADQLIQQHKAAGDPNPLPMWGDLGYLNDADMDALKAAGEVSGYPQTTSLGR